MVNIRINNNINFKYKKIIFKFSVLIYWIHKLLINDLVYGGNFIYLFYSIKDSGTIMLRAFTDAKTDKQYFIEGKR